MLSLILATTASLGSLSLARSLFHYNLLSAFSRLVPHAWFCSSSTPCGVSIPYRTLCSYKIYSIQWVVVSSYFVVQRYAPKVLSSRQFFFCFGRNSTTPPRILNLFANDTQSTHCRVVQNFILKSSNMHKKCFWLSDAIFQIRCGNMKCVWISCTE